MIDVKEIFAVIDKEAPYIKATEWDNSGIIYDNRKQTDKVMFALDVTKDVLAEAKEKGCGIVVSHHPALFKPKNNFSIDDIVMLAAYYDISLVCAHTNFDYASRGVNKALTDKLGFITDGDFCEFGRTATFDKPAKARELAAFVKSALGCECLRYTETDHPIHRVAIGGGGAGEFIDDAVEGGFDAFITGEAKHSDMLEARKKDICLIIVGHYETEKPCVVNLMEIVQEGIDGKAELMMSEAEKNPCCYL